MNTFSNSLLMRVFCFAKLPPPNTLCTAMWDFQGRCRLYLLKTEYWTLLHLRFFHIWQCSRSIRSLSTRWAGVGETAHVVVQEVRKTKPPVTPVYIQGAAVNIYEYLGVHIVNKLDRSKNTLHKKPPLFPEEAESTQKQTGGLHQSLQLITLISAGHDSHNQPTHLSPYLIFFALFCFALVYRVLLILKYIKIHL